MKKEENLKTRRKRRELAIGYGGEREKERRRRLTFIGSLSGASSFEAGLIGFAAPSAGGGDDRR